jgi:hypothetical protein
MFKATFDFNKKKIDAEYTLDKKEVQADFNLNIIPSISHLATKEELEKAADKHFEFEQGIASDVWVIEHNLGKKPSIMVVDSADNVVEGAERYIDENTIEIRFNGAFKGKAYLN